MFAQSRIVREASPSEPASERVSAGGHSALGKLCEGDGATGLEQCKGGRPGHLDDGGGGGWVAGIYRASAERK